MRKPFLIVPILCAVFLVACSGSQKPKQNNADSAQNAETMVSTETESSETEAIVNNEGELADVPDDNSTIAMRFWKKMLKDYDPFGRLDGDEQPTEKIIAEALENIMKIGNTVAFFEDESVEGFRETAACYQKKDGSWIVLLYWSSNDSPNHKLNAYNFDGSNITRLENYFPDDFLADGRYISSLDTDEFAVVCDTDEEEIVDWYKWNGEKFVKQSDD